MTDRPAPTPTAFVVLVPGAFETFLSGTGAVAGDVYSTDPELERGARELRDAYLAGERIVRGRGHSDRLTLPSIEAAVVLAEYVEACIGANYGGDVDYAEVTAARKVADRIRVATGGRVDFNGWYVAVDGEKRT